MQCLLKLFSILIGGILKGKIGTVLFPLMVALFQVYSTVKNWDLTIHIPHTKDVCPFIVYCLTEF